MGWRSSAAIFAFLGGASLSMSADETIERTNPNDGWKFVKEGGGVSLYSRARAGSSLKEFKAVGEIDAPTRAVHTVIDDLDSYPSFMPYTTECRLIKRDGDSFLTYKRLSPKIVGDRDFTLRIRKKSWPGQDGLVYLNEWEPANEFGPSDKPCGPGVNRNEGSWLLEPAGATKTRATYFIYTDSGGKLPAFLANVASEIGIKKVFAAVRKQVKDPKYRAN